MTPEERVESLREMLPGLRDYLYEYLAADGASVCRDGDISYQRDIIDPLVAVMKRLHFTEAKSQRVANYCGEYGRKAVVNAFYGYRSRLRRSEADDIGVAGVVLANVDTSNAGKVDAAANVINQLNEGRNEYAHLKFDAHRAMLALAAERRLRQLGRITNWTSFDQANALIRSVVLRCERRPDRSMDEVLGVAAPRWQNPNMVFGDGRFGDGTRLMTVTQPDGSTEMVRTSLVEPLIPEFRGMSRPEIEQAIQEKLAAAQAAAE